MGVYISRDERGNHGCACCADSERSTRELPEDHEKTDRVIELKAQLEKIQEELDSIAHEFDQD